MAKKIFMVAKELGVDYQVLLKSCREIGLVGRNYMSLLREEEYRRLLQHVNGGGEESKTRT